MLENPFVFRLITQLLTLFATVVLLFREPQNHSKNTWITHVESKQKNSEVSEAKASWKLLLCLFCRLEKTWRGHFPFHHPLGKIVYHMATFCACKNGKAWNKEWNLQFTVFNFIEGCLKSKVKITIIWKECLEVSLVHPTLTAVNWLPNILSLSKEV